MYFYKVAAVPLFVLFIVEQLFIKKDLISFPSSFLEKVLELWLASERSLLDVVKRKTVNALQHPPLAPLPIVQRQLYSDS